MTRFAASLKISPIASTARTIVHYKARLTIIGNSKIKTTQFTGKFVKPINFMIQMSILIIRVMLIDNIPDKTVSPRRLNTKAARIFHAA